MPRQHRSLRMLELPPPQNLEAERAVLGSALMDDSACRWILTNLIPEAFYEQKNRWVFDCLLELRRENEVIDFLSVGEKLKHRGQYGDFGGHEGLIELQDAVATWRHFEY